MANRYGYQFQMTLERNVWKVYAKVSFGASGAPTVDTSVSKGVRSVVRDSAGVYTVTFGNPAPNAATDTYSAFLSASATFLLAAGLPAAPAMNARAFTGSAGTLQIVFSDLETPAATDPASGEVVYLEFTLKN